ncbi:MAG: hypothetical protein A2937_01880 [Candidatus Yonathbacteria bacterium RIFCSPLOWO2_01_FULL_47_33b]|uniref:Uncharacterized protein n=1 Tax=Candidatus Yonathbacteria bacterium RIFCSPLOWO2_01_FULL_47_33b TaxID=1802727 RepID=A0A1G2SFI1_9BACT|nr:MAG: hypothetical protein A2937_01880 [Candidatus Yonathbacteria bacterium RIFCSPLOWO2_01_FULL_47_33b]
MKFNLKEDLRKTFKIGSTDFKSAIMGIVILLISLVLLSGLLIVWNSFGEPKSQYNYEICTKGILSNCVKVDRYNINSAGTCVRYWGEKEGTLCKEFYIEENK